MKQVRYFEAMYHGTIANFYTKYTVDFECWTEALKSLDIPVTVTYIAYDDGTTEGKAE